MVIIHSANHHNVFPVLLDITVVLDKRLFVLLDISVLRVLHHKISALLHNTVQFKALIELYHVLQGIIVLLEL